MLSKTDKGWLTKEIQRIFEKEIAPQLREMIQEEFKEALFVEIAVERKRKDEGTTKEFANVLHQLVWEIPQWVGALRGLQEDGVNVFNRMRESMGLIEVMGKTLGDMEQGVLTMSEFGNALVKTGLLAQLSAALTIEYQPENSDESIIGS